MAAVVGALRVELGASTANFEAGLTRAQARAKAAGTAISGQLTTSLNRSRTSMVGVGQQLQDIVVGLQSGQRATTVFAQQLPQLAFQMSFAEGKIGRVARFLSGPWGAAVLVAGGLLANFISSLRESEERASAAVTAQDALSRATSQLGEMFDLATGKIKDNSEALRLNTLMAANNLAVQAQNQLFQARRNIRDGASVSRMTRFATGVYLSSPGVQTLDRLAGGNARRRLSSALGAEATVNQILADYRAGRISAEDAQQRLLATGAPPGLLNRSPADFAQDVTDEINAQAALDTATRMQSSVSGGVLDPQFRTATRGAGSGGGGGSAGSRAGSSDQDVRRDAQYQSELRRNQVDLLRAQQDQLADAAARSELDLQILAIEKEEHDAGIRLRQRLGEIGDAQADRLLAGNQAVYEERRQAIIATRQRQVRQENLQIDENVYRRRREALQDELSLADTAQARREIEQRILDLDLRHEEARLRAVEADEDAGRVAQEDARQRLAALNETRSRQQTLLNNRNLGPFGDFLASLPTTAERANEALQKVAAEGLSSISDGLAAAIVGAKSLAATFKQVARQIIADLIKIQIERSIVGPLANALGGVFGGAGAKFGGGRAAGGPVIPGEFYRVGENGPEWLVAGTSGRIIPSGAGPRGGGQVEIVLRDELLDARIVRGSAVVVRQAAPAIAANGAGMALKTLSTPRL